MPLTAAYSQLREYFRGRNRGRRSPLLEMSRIPNRDVDDWLGDYDSDFFEERQVSHSFVVGDEVEIKDDCKRYNITKPGSRGVILEISARYAQVRFNVLPPKYTSYLGENYEILLDDLVLFNLTEEQLKERKTKEIMKTINRLHTRQHFYKTNAQTLEHWA